MSKRALVLAVEDDERFVSVLNRWLKDEEIDVISATTISDAEEQLRSRRNDYDTIVLDLGMDESSGIDTFQRIAIAMGDPKRIPIVVLTAAELSADEVRRLFHAGAQDVLNKLIPPQQIVRAIQAAIRAKPSLAQTRKDSPVPGFAQAVQFLEQIRTQVDEGVAHAVAPLCERIERIENHLFPPPDTQHPKGSMGHIVFKFGKPSAREIGRGIFYCLLMLSALKVAGPSMIPQLLAEAAQKVAPESYRAPQRHASEPQQGKRGASAADAQEVIAVP